MNYKYRHLLSPIKIGNVVLKNRMLSTNALPHGLQGPESFPADAMISFYSNLAKNGAAAVTFRGCELHGGRHMFDIQDHGVQNYLVQLAEAIHFYNAKASVALTIDSDIPGYDISDVIPPATPDRTEKYRLTGGRKEASVKMIKKLIGDISQSALLYKSLGWDMVNIYMTYRSSIFANSLSPAMNKRTDQYGGSFEKRARLTIELCRTIKKVCGEEFLIEAQVSGEEEPGGYTLNDLVKYTKLWEGSIDILQLRGWDGATSHPTGFNSQKKYPITLHYAQAIKEGGAKIVTAPNGGFQDLELNEEYIASGKTDMVAMGRAFFCDSEYYRKAIEGRGEDVVPCIRCNKCHGPYAGHLTAVCSVNPVVGIGHKVNRMIDTPIAAKKVAVIGGGPAGMKAAIVAAERGHKVTLYEKNFFLGGQLRHADYASFKWPLRDFKEFLIRQTYKAGVNVLLSTEAASETIKSGGYDAVLVAVGAEPGLREIPGTASQDVWTPVDVFGREKELGKNIVVIGGAQIGMETAIYLAQNGHDVTVLTRRKKQDLGGEAIVHYHETFRVTWESMDNIKCVTEATATEISKGRVIYKDVQGKIKSIKTDNTVVAGGMNPRQEEAMTFAGSAPDFAMIGDCNAVGNVQTCMRNAFAMASQI
jgi:2,4-dienoyl-CoA reductase-like NADH-dependent reductase (Old Yellow Enzyme family)/thioredoxin reductase